MTGVFRSQLGAVWAVLVAATCASWWLDADHGATGDTGRTVATTLVLAIAFAKVRYIGLVFMELRTAPAALRLAFEGWVLLVGGVLIVLYLTA